MSLVLFQAHFQYAALALSSIIFCTNLVHEIDTRDWCCYYSLAVNEPFLLLQESCVQWPLSGSICHIPTPCVVFGLEDEDLRPTVRLDEALNVVSHFQDLGILT